MGTVDDMPSMRFCVCVLATFLIAGGCAWLDGNEIHIAIEGPISGDQSSNGIDMRNGAQLAIDEINRSGNVLGKELALVEADDAADPKQGVRVAKEMIGRRVFAVIGPYNSSVGIENLPLYDNAGVVPIHLTSNHATNGMGFTVQQKDYQTAPVEAEALGGYLRAKSVAIVYDTSTYTAGIAKDLKSELAEMGVAVPVYEPIEEGTERFADVLDTVSAAAADVLYIGTYFPEAALIVREAAAARTPGRCFLGLAAQDPAFVKAAGIERASRCLSSGVPSAGQFPGAKEYVSAYRKAFDREPGIWGTFTYDSVKFLVDGVRRAGVWDAKKVTRELSRTKDLTGISGSITIDPKTGNRVDAPVVVLEITEKGDYRVDPGWAEFSGFSQGQAISSPRTRPR